MKVTPGKDWIKQGKKVSGVGEIQWKAFGSLKRGFCSSESNHPTLNDASDTNSLWVAVKWPGDNNFCHRIGAGGKYDLKEHTQCKIFFRLYLYLTFIYATFYSKGKFSTPLTRILTTIVMF